MNFHFKEGTMWTEEDIITRIDPITKRVEDLEEALKKLMNYVNEINTGITYRINDITTSIIEVQRSLKNIKYGGFV